MKWAIAFLVVLDLPLIVWCVLDANALRRRYGPENVGGFSPWVWLILGILFSWVTGIVYLFTRRAYYKNHGDKGIYCTNCEEMTNSYDGYCPICDEPIEELEDLGDVERPAAAWFQRWPTIAVWGIAVVVIGTTGILNLVSEGSSPQNTISNGPTQAVLNANIKTQLSRHGVPAISSVICVPPKSWTPGATFKCFVYNSQSSGLGQYIGTVLPMQGDYFEWNGQWIPT